MSFNAQQFRELVVRPQLWDLDPHIPYSQEAEDLLVMTAAHESHLGTYLKQVNGPALGVYQMEPATHDDIWYNYLEFQGGIKAEVSMLTNQVDYVGPGAFWLLVYNLRYATAMARVHYYRVSEALPKRSDFETRSDYVLALAKYAKKYYNTDKGKATVEDYYRAFNNLEN